MALPVGIGCLLACVPLGCSAQCWEPCKFAVRGDCYCHCYCLCCYLRAGRMRFRSHLIFMCFDEERRCRGALWCGGMAWCWESGGAEKEEGGRQSTYGRLPGTDVTLGFQGPTLGSGECIGERNGVRGMDTFVWHGYRDGHERSLSGCSR